MATIVDFVENALGCSSREVRRLAAERPGDLLARRESLYATMETSWLSVGIDDLPAAAENELRPIYGRGLLTGGGPLSSYYGDSPEHAASTREIKALLLYAHSTVVLNPLLPWFDVDDAGLVSEGRPDGMAFVRALETLVDLAPLIRDGTVLIAEPPEVVWLEGVDVAGGLAEVGREARQSGQHWDQWDAFARAKDTLMRLVAYGALDPQDHGRAIAVSPDDDGAALSEFVRTLAAYLEPERTLPTENARLAALMELSLPGVDGLTAGEMVDVRLDDKFLTFRTDMRAALTEAGQSLHHGEIESARADVAEHMAARAAELRTAPARTRLWHATSSGAIGWAVGASLTSLAGWKAALLGLVTRSAYDTARDRPSAASRALLQHYVALARSPSSAPPGDAASSIRAWRRSLE